MNDDTGASSVEYGILAAVIAAGIILVVGALGNEVVALFQTVQFP